MMLVIKQRGGDVVEVSGGRAGRFLVAVKPDFSLFSLPLLRRDSRPLQLLAVERPRREAVTTGSAHGTEADFQGAGRVCGQETASEHSTDPQTESWKVTLHTGQRGSVAGGAQHAWIAVPGAAGPALAHVERRRRGEEEEGGWRGE